MVGEGDRVHPSSGKVQDGPYATVLVADLYSYTAGYVEIAIVVKKNLTGIGVEIVELLALAAVITYEGLTKETLGLNNQEQKDGT